MTNNTDQSSIAGVKRRKTFLIFLGIIFSIGLFLFLVYHISEIIPVILVVVITGICLYALWVLSDMIREMFFNKEQN